jgi:hypothetical protein
MGELLLTDKEATGLVIGGITAATVPKPRWAAVGKVCSPRKLIISALDRAMQRAWGLHHPAQFKDIGDNRFVVRFTSEGDWKHVMNNGPWQFDFNAVLLKKYDGAVRPSDMVFDTMDIWVRVLDLPMDKMNRVYGELIGRWIGKYISVDVDADGIAWGEDLRIRVEVRVDQPLLRGVNIRDSDEDVEGTWFDLKYEKVPHFCFSCGCVVHPENKCLGEDEEEKQWGEWLRASPRRNKKPVAVSRPAVSSNSFSSRSAGSENRFHGGASIRDIPARRNLNNEYAYSSSSRTGENQHRRGMRDVTSPKKGHRATGMSVEKNKGPAYDEGQGRKGGTFVRRQRNTDRVHPADQSQLPLGTNRKRSTKQVWLPVAVQVLGEEDSDSAGKRQKVQSVFDRMEEPAQSVFDRLEVPSADPAQRGRREQ